tara:strand:- start:1636 stop:2022 length:387 start_codon:yes stop_codon:yes gene_type:complete
MNFVKEIRNKQIEFFVEKNSITNVVIRIEIPPYGVYSRGELYTSEELNILIKEEIQDLASLDNDGRFLAHKKNYKNVILHFKKQTTGLEDVVEAKSEINTKIINKAIKSKSKKTTKNKIIKDASPPRK